MSASAWAGPVGPAQRIWVAARPEHGAWCAAVSDENRAEGADERCRAGRIGRYLKDGVVFACVEPFNRVPFVHTSVGLRTGRTRGLGG